MTTTSKSGRPQRGQLLWKEGSGWEGRYYATVDGVRVRVRRVLHTEHKPVARRKLARLIAEGNVAPDAARRPETFEEAARRVLDAARAAGMATWKDRQHRLETYTFPTLGPMLPERIKAAHVRALLEEVRALGKARQTLVHVKNDVSTVLGDLWRAELLPENVCQRVRVPEASPEATERSKKERAVLSDDELALYLAWSHPDERHRGAVLERQTMACVARCFGGLRTSDLHAIRWEGFETAAGAFTFGTAPRRKGHRLAKGGKPQRLLVPDVLRPILRDWWERHGRPAEGLLFPVRKGDGAGVEGRKHSSHAKAFRRDLLRAFGLETWDATAETWTPAERPPTARERQLLTETDGTMPVDFHSWRRAFNQALADAGVNAQQAQALAGHSTMAAHERYLRNTQRMQAVPEGALPRIGIGPPTMGPLNERQRTVANDAADVPPDSSLKLAAGACGVTCKASALPLSYPPGVAGP